MNSERITVLVFQPAAVRVETRDRLKLYYGNFDNTFCVNTDG